ncbi:hypothetical protein Tco_0343460 [Tanacetum coccineum]
MSDYSHIEYIVSGERLTSAPRLLEVIRVRLWLNIGTWMAEIITRSKDRPGVSRQSALGVWVDLTKSIEEVAPTTLERVNARVTELAAVQEQDTQDIYAVIEITQKENSVIKKLMDWSRIDIHYELQAYRTHTQMQDYRIASQESLMTTLIAQVHPLWGQFSAALGQGFKHHQARAQTHTEDPKDANNMPPRRTSAAARAAAAAPMTVAVVEQLIEARVSAALANHETL